MLDKDEVTGAHYAGLNLAGKLATKTEYAFDERWYAKYSDNEKWFIQTQTEGLFRANSRLGTGLLKAHEKPNFREILKKLNLKFEDKPPLKAKE